MAISTNTLSFGIKPKVKAGTKLVLSTCLLLQSCSSPPQSKEKRLKSSKQRTNSAQPALRAAGTKQKVNESVQTGDVKYPAGAHHRLAWSSDGGRSTSPSDRYYHTTNLLQIADI